MNTYETHLMPLASELGFLDHINMQYSEEVFNQFLDTYGPGLHAWNIT